MGGTKTLDPCKVDPTLPALATSAAQNKPLPVSAGLGGACTFLGSL
jgi:hypothetical protein